MAEFAQPAWRTYLATVGGYLVILVVMTVLLFLLPFLAFVAL